MTCTKSLIIKENQKKNSRLISNQKAQYVGCHHRVGDPLRYDLIKKVEDAGVAPRRATDL